MKSTPIALFKSHISRGYAFVTCLTSLSWYPSCLVNIRVLWKFFTKKLYSAVIYVLGTWEVMYVRVWRKNGSEFLINCYEIQAPRDLQYGNSH